MIFNILNMNSDEKAEALKNIIQTIQLSFNSVTASELRDSLQTLLLLLAKCVDDFKHKAIVQECFNGFQIITAIVSNVNLSVLLDSEILFPTLSQYLDPLWSQLDISHLSFAATYNLIRLNTNRITEFVKANGISSLEKYFQHIHKRDPSKANLVLSLLYSIGYVESCQDEFVSQGGLKCILGKVDQTDHAIVFLMKFVNSNTPIETLNIILNHHKLRDELETPGSSIKRKGLLAMLLRSIALHKNTSTYVLSKLKPYLINPDFDLNEVLVGIVSNLVVTNAETINFEKDIIESGILKTIFDNLGKDAIEHVSENDNMKSIWLSICQILNVSIRQKSIWNIPTASSLMLFSSYCITYLENSIYFGQVLSKFATSFYLKDILPLKVGKWTVKLNTYSSSLDDGEGFTDSDFPPVSKSYYSKEMAIGDPYSEEYINLVWRRSSDLYSSDNFYGEKIIASSVVQGIVDDNNIALVLSGIAHVSPIYVKSLFNETSKDKYSIKIFDNKLEKWRAIEVDDYLPCYLFGKPVGLSSYNNSYWQLIIEKALAKHCGSYDQLKTLNLNDVAMLLTGKEMNTFDIDEGKDHAQLNDEIQDMLLTKNLTILNLNSKLYVIKESFYTERAQYVTVYDPNGFDKRLGYSEQQSVIKLTFSQLVEQGKAILFTKL